MAQIESALGIEATLVEGHDGIYEITVGDEIVFTTETACTTGFPEEWDIVEKVGRLTGVEPRPAAPIEAGLEEAPAPACPVPGLETPEPPKQSCGCGPPAQAPAKAPGSSSACC